MKTQVRNWNNEVVSEIELPENVFGATWNPELVKQVIVAQLANRRRPWAHVKDRGAVSGGGKKPWRQKGTGRARHGSTRSPIWSGGGVTHGPNKERDYSQKINKKMRQLAIFSVLSKKLSDQEMKVFESLIVAEPKTKPLFEKLVPVLEKTKSAKKMDVLFVPAPDNKNLFRAARNLVKTKVVGAESLNVYDLVNYKHLIIDQGAIPVILKHYSKVGTKKTAVKAETKAAAKRTPKSKK